MNINSIQFHSGIVEQASETKMLCCGTGSLRRFELLIFLFSFANELWLLLNMLKDLFDSTNWIS